MAKAKAKSSKVSKEEAQAIKTFRNSSEIESFYRYIADNKLRAEAHFLISKVIEATTPKRRSRKTLQ